MLVGKPLYFIEEYVAELSLGLTPPQRPAGLSPGQQAWLSFCLMCIMVTESVCWRNFVRAGLGRYSEALLSFYFNGPLTWELLLAISTHIVLKYFNTWEGILVIDDSGKKRSKTTTQIPYVHYFKNPQGTGTLKGQEVVFLVLVTPIVTLPVGYEFYQPDPAYTAWSKASRDAKTRGGNTAKRTKRPALNPAYPTKAQIALGLLERFGRDCPYVKVKAVLADALYGPAEFLARAARVFTQIQVISQLRRTQKVRDRRRGWTLNEYFKAYPGVLKTVRVRGGTDQEMLISSARLYVEAQHGMRFVVAIRSPQELEYRYLVATDLSWRTEDIVQTYTLRWLVETVIEDLKVHEGWGQATKQPGIEGSRRVLTLSLLCDHCLILHPEQRAQAEAKQPLYTIGSLQRRLKITAMTAWLEQWLDGEGLIDKITQLTQLVLPLVPLQESSKHQCGRTQCRQEATPALKSRANQALAWV